CEVGTTHWVQCNDTPVKFARFPVTGLVEGRSYIFRVRAVNKSGISRPSRVSEPVAAMDPADRARMRDNWQRVNTEIPVKSPRFALFDLAEGKSYLFRVRCCNSAGVGEPSEPTETITVGDKLGEQYVFRVRAVNAAGLSQFSPISEPVEVKAAIASPAPPYGITVLECVQDSMVLSWKQPTFIGGADITGYFVDYRQVVDGVPGKWHEANVKAVSDRAYRVRPWEVLHHPGVLQLKYQFQVRAANMAGVGIPSMPSDTFLCEEWTIAVREVRSDSLVLLWKPPVYQGRDPVNGFYVDIKEGDAPEEAWRGVNTKAAEKTYLKVFTWRTKEIVVQVDDDGVISLNFENSDLTPDSKFVWSKNYEEITDTSRLTIETKGSKSQMVFNSPGEDDVGVYSCLVTHTDGASSSYTLSEEDEGTYTFQLKDGKATNQSSLVLIGDGPHFIEGLSWEVGNMKKETSALWHKDGHQIKADEHLGFAEGVLKLEIAQALNLTCNISGNPVPEVTWLKNDREITSDEHCILKFESGKFASFTITGVNTSDSGKYSILVKNKFGTESGDFTVSVFIPEEAGAKKK
ncbi:hypothetical protein GOODEAATRI_008660, partial [Goodea atripinnis]